MKGASTRPAGSRRAQLGVRPSSQAAPHASSTATARLVTRSPAAEPRRRRRATPSFRRRPSTYGPAYRQVRPARPGRRQAGCVARLPHLRVLASRSSFLGVSDPTHQDAAHALRSWRGSGIPGPGRNHGSQRWAGLPGCRRDGHCRPQSQVDQAACLGRHTPNRLPCVSTRCANSILPLSTSGMATAAPSDSAWLIAAATSSTCT